MESQRGAPEPAAEPASRAVGRAASWTARLAVAAVIVAVVAVVYLLGRGVAARRAGFTIDKTTPVVSELDGVGYRVHGAYADAQAAADTLATINRRVIDLMRWLRARYVRGPDGDRYPARRQATLRLLARYNPDNLAENSPKDPTGDTSYVLEKGAVVAICLRSRDSSGAGPEPIHDLETLTFVTLHEMSHIAVDTLQHERPFWEAFKFILLEAEAAGLYTSPDYAASPRYYCGIKVDYNPRLDPATDPTS